MPDFYISHNNSQDTGREYIYNKSCSGRILVAEDDNSVRIFITRALEQAGYEVTAVEDGYLALEALKRASFDLLITDVVMPGLDGIALTFKATHDHPNLRVVIISGYASERQRAADLRVPAIATLPKPFTLAEIRQHTAAAIAGVRDQESGIRSQGSGVRN